MYHHTKINAVMIPVIASLFSLAVSSSVLAQNAGRRSFSAPQETTVTDEEKEVKPRDRRTQRQIEQARTEQDQAAQATREQQERARLNETRREQVQSEQNRQQVAREEIRQRQNIERQNSVNRQAAEQNALARRNDAAARESAAREAAAQRLATDRQSAERARQNRDNLNERPDPRADQRTEDRVIRGRDNNANPASPVVTRQLRPEQERQQRQWQDQQQRQANEYLRHLDTQQTEAQRFTQRLREQNRNEQYRSQQRYYERVREQRRRFDNNKHDYYRGSYYYSPIIYRYSRGGHYYYANRYQADLMRQALNYGYEEGFYAGRADRMDRWGYNFREAYAYQDANYGYYGYYVDRGTYNYYFREGFRRGYDDGYYGRYRYGRRYNSGYSLNDSILRIILNFRDWR